MKEQKLAKSSSLLELEDRVVESIQNQEYGLLINNLKSEKMQLNDYCPMFRLLNHSIELSAGEN
jgi:hypothetical protein